MDKKISGHQTLLLPRAEDVIKQTIASLWTVKFETDPLMHMNESFMVSIWDSAKKRDGAVIEAAIMDAIEQTPALRLLPISAGKRRVDVQFEICATGHIVALEIKRGSLQDSKAIRQFRADLIEMPEAIRKTLPLSAAIIHFHIVFITGTPPIAEGLKLADLKKLYKLDASLHIDQARRKFSDEVRAVIQGRTK